MEITEKEFNSLNCHILFENSKYNRKFGLVTIENKEFRFAWRSDLVKPVIVEINLNIICLGIDQNFVIVDLNKNKTLTNLNLFYNLLDIQIFQQRIFVITELEIITFNKKTFKKLAEYALPEFFEEIIFSDNKILVNCSENTNIII